MSETRVTDTSYSWLRLAITLAVAVVGNVGIWAIVVVMPAVQAEFGIDRADVSLTYTMTMIGFALGNFAIGRVVDRFGISTALIGAAILSGGAYVLAAQAGSIVALGLIQMAIGLGTAATFGPLMADISHWFLRRRGLAVAVVASGNYLAGSVWPLLLAQVLEDRGWRAVYLALALATVALMVPLALLLRRRMPQDGHDGAERLRARNTAGAVFSGRTLQMMLAAAGFGCCMAMAMPQVHIVALCVDLGYGAGVGAQMLAVMLAGGVVSRLASGLIADRLGGVRTILIGSALQGLALLLYLPAGGLVSLYAVSLVFGLAQGGIVPSYTVVVREYLPAREAGARVGFVIMATILGMAVGGWVSGWIFDLTGSYRMAFLHGIAWNVFNIGIMALILVRGGRRAVPA